jgi:RecA/RadA recombinase
MKLHEILEIKKHQIIDTNEIDSLSKDSKKNQIILPLGQRNFDDVLEGGFYSGRKYVIFGPNKTGKTQLCHQLCVQAYKHLHEVFDSKNHKFIFYFDTENTFRPERIEELLASTGFEIDRVLKNIMISKIMSNSALLLALKNFEKTLLKGTGGILIIDTINNHFRFDLSNKDVVFQRIRDRFINILEIINQLTNRYNLITILTAQVVSNFSKSAIIREIPVGYQFLNHFISEFVYLSKENNEKNYVQLVNSLIHPEKKVLYNITSKGIHDYKI